MARRGGLAAVIEAEVNHMLGKYDVGEGGQVD